MKKLVLVSFALLFIGFIPHVFAQGFVPLAEIPGLTDPGTATSIINAKNFANFFNNLYKYCIGLASALAVIMIIWGGLEISTQDSISQQSKGRERITQAIYGLILVLSPVLVFSIINPAILNLSIGLEPLGTVTGAPVTKGVLGGGFGSSGPTPTSCPAGQLVCSKTNTCLSSADCVALNCSPDGLTCCGTGSKFCAAVNGCILPTATCGLPSAAPNNCADSTINSCGSDNNCICASGTTRQCATNGKPVGDPNRVERFICN